MLERPLVAHSARAGAGPLPARTSLHEQVAEHLRDMIVQGKLPPGERLHLATLASALEVSPTPLREALKILGSEQLVELRPNRPSRVAQVTAAGTRALFEVMAEIESMAAAMAADRITKSNMVLLDRLHAEMSAHHEADRRAAYFAANRQIHDALVEHAGNPVLAQLRGKLALRAEQARFMAVSHGGRRRAALDEHQALMRALHGRDPERVRRVWREHLLNSGDEICRLLERNNLH